jgi:uncharacterized protein (TIGR02302 family)
MAERDSPARKDDRVALNAIVPVALARTIRRTRLAIGLETLTRAFWPVWSLGFLAFALVRLELLSLLWEPARLPVLVLIGIAALVFLVRGLRRFRWPGEADAVARIDDALPGRPVAALGDRQAAGTGDPGARGVWAAHMAAVARAALRARAARPDLRLSRQDPRALRYGAFALFVAALLLGRGTLTEQVSPAIAPPAEAAIATGPVLEAWASPPGYTGRPTLYLTETAAGTPLPVPEGTTITLRLYADGEGASLVESVAPAATPGSLTATGPGLAQSDFIVERSGEVAVRLDGQLLGSWTFEMIPDLPPAVALAGDPERAASGAAEFSYTGRDDYGITAAWARITLDTSRIDARHGLGTPPEAREPIEFDLPLPLTGEATHFTEKEVIDLSLHPWAGLPVIVTLFARDAAGQETASEPHAVELPGRRFYEPLARAVVEQRRDLLWSAENAGRVGRLLKAVSWRPDEIFAGTKAFLVLRTAIRRLDYAIADGRLAAERDGIAELLWQAAVLIEDGDLGTALERLRRAEERLSRAMEEGASEQELAELMEEFREAMQDYLRELMRQALENEDGQRNPEQQSQMDPQGEMSMQDLQQMMEEIERLMQEGRMAEAQELLDQLRQLMENLRMTMRPGPPQPGQGEQMMQGLQDLLRQQQELGDQTFGELQRQFGQGMGEGEQEGEPRPGPGTGELSRRQEALRQLLDQLGEGLPPGTAGREGRDPMEEARRALEEAERDMGEARDRLEEGDPGSAVDEQAEAIDNLRDGVRALGDALREAQRQRGPEGGMTAEEQPYQRRDPLGRPLGPTGSIDSDDVKIPEGEAFKRSRELQGEIRRRAGEQDRPKPELDYLKRLLERF